MYVLHCADISYTKEKDEVSAIFRFFANKGLTLRCDSEREFPLNTRDVRVCRLIMSVRQFVYLYVNNRGRRAVNSQIGLCVSFLIFWNPIVKWFIVKDC